MRKEARLFVASNNKGRGGSGGAGGSGSGDGPDGGGGGEGGGSSAVKVAALKQALDQAKENEVRLLARASWGVVASS
jgi:hypothetical protein